MNATLTLDLPGSIVPKTARKASRKIADKADVLVFKPVLSEEEVLAMAAKDYMNDEQLAFFKSRLQQMEQDLLQNASETSEHLRETELISDPADRATIEEEHSLELRTRDRERKLLRKVQQCVASIDTGDYGWCEETGEAIGLRRLLARPTATLSIEAQQRHELKQKLAGH
ncbi:MAG: RNA polymerase-binding protein DksA [Pseudomonadota bacterium]